MYLKNCEKDLLDGKYGEGAAIAMKVQVAIGEAFGAERMVEISRAHVALSNQEADLWFVEKLVNGGATCKVHATVNPAFNLEYFRKVSSVNDKDADTVQRTYKAYRTIGATLTFSCTPYLTGNIPRAGEVTAFSESSATPYVNSVCGARSKRESAQSALCAAVTGRVPEYGLLLTQHRKGEILVQVDADLRNDFDYQLLGYCVPPKIGFSLPVFTGIPPNPTPEALINLGAQLNTAGAVPLYHIVGVTPEAPTLEASFGGNEPTQKVTITDRDLREVHKAISKEGGKIDFVMLGCPHHTISQVRQTAEMVEGKKLAAELWSCTSFLTKELARRMGFLDIIVNAGGHIVEDTCVDQPCWRHLYGKVGITDSPKCAYYTKRRGMEFVIRSLAECIEAGLKGEAK